MSSQNRAAVVMTDKTVVEKAFSIVVVGFVRSIVDFGIAHNASAIYALSKRLGAEFSTTLLDVSDICKSGVSWYGCRKADLQDAAPVNASSFALPNATTSLYVYCMPLDLFPAVFRDFTSDISDAIARPNAHNMLYAPWELEKCSNAIHRLYKRFFRDDSARVGSNWSFCTVSTFSKSVFDTILSEATSQTKRCFVFAVPARDVASLCNRKQRCVTGDTKTWVVSFAMDFCSGFERKNPFAAVDAFVQSLQSEDGSTGNKSDRQPVFSLKTSNFGKMSAAFRQYWCAQWTRRVQQNATRAQFVWQDADWTREAYLEWLSECDVYISLHRSEGFGFTLFEAMALGKPCVATRYGGNTDFMTEQNSLLVKYQMTEVSKRAARCYRFKGARWAEPDVAEAVNALQTLRLRPNLAAEIGLRAREHIRQDWSLESRAAVWKKLFYTTVHKDNANTSHSTNF